MSQASTKRKLFSLIDDVEIISKELFELLAMPKQQRAEDIDTGQLIELLIQKDGEIQENLLVAQEQIELQKKLEELQREVAKRDLEIQQLQRCLKEAENILSNAIYQAKQRLETIKQATERKHSSEEIIKFAHRISSNNAVAAPSTWAPGDPRRPFPTEREMRPGLLARLGELPINSQNLPSSSFADSLPTSRSHLGSSDHLTPSTANSTPPAMPPWHTAGEMSSSAGMLSGAKSRKDEDIEMMSSDSSSSSSSDE